VSTVSCQAPTVETVAHDTGRRPAGLARRDPSAALQDAAWPSAGQGWPDGYGTMTLISFEAGLVPQALRA